MFSIAGDRGDTQILHADPAPSDSRSSDCEADDGCVDDEIPVLYGKTQATDDVDCGDDAVGGGQDGGVKGCGETQLVDTGADESPERTKLLSEEAGASSFAGTSCDASNGRRGCAEDRTDGGDHWPPEKEEDSIDSDTSDDEDMDAGSRRRSFTDIRAKAVRSSGLAAYRHLASKKHGSDQSKKVDNSKVGGTDVRSFGVNNWVENKKYLTNLYSEIGELQLEHGMENSIWSSEDQQYKQGDKDNRSSNRRVRKLFDETYLENDESGNKADETAEKKSMPHLFATDNIAGLSYIVSQEPGDQSQANALEVVDKFLLTNDVGSSQEFKNGISDIVKCAPVSCSKILGYLAEKIDRRSSIGIPSIFDWDDNLEDEGGGDFFCKRKDSLFEGTSAARKAKSHPPKTSLSLSGRSRGVFENLQEVKGENKNNCTKATTLPHSDSQLVMQNLIKNGMLHISQTKVRKNLCMAVDEDSNPKALEDNLEIADAEVLEGVYNCRPDTQMAAEAMKALCHESPVNPDKEEIHLTPGISGQKSNEFVKKRAPPENAFQQKRTSPADPSDAEGIITRSMRKRIQATKEIGELSVLHTDLSINSRMKKSHEHRSSKVKTRMESFKLHGQLTAEISEGHAASESIKRKKGEREFDETSDRNVDISVDQWNGDGFFNKELEDGNKDGDSDPAEISEGHAASESIKRKKGERELDETSDRNVDISVDQWNGYGFFNKELEDGNKDGDSDPVAHRTKHSKRAKLLEDAQTISKESEPDANGLRNMNKEGNFIADASASQETKTESANIDPQFDVEVRKFCSNSSWMPISGNLLEETMVDHPEHKRTQHTSGNQILENNGNKPAVSIENLARTVRHTKNGERKKVYIRSVSEILVKAKQKRRIVSTQMLLEIDAMLSDSKLAPGMPLRRTRSLQKSTSESNKCLSQSVSNQASLVEPVTLCYNSLNDSAVDAEKLSIHKSGEDAEQAEQNAQLESLSREKIQSSNLACATPSKRENALSPVCVADDLPRALKKLSTTTPVARELLRLEPSEASAMPLQKDVDRKKDMTSFRVLFSNHLDEDTVKQQKKILPRLRIAVASSISDATHFVADKFMRTQNMLEAIAFGKPVVTSMWLESCGQASCFLDERNYILRDTEKEKEIGFNMQVSLARACQCPILLGKTVYMTPNVKPSREILSSVVKAANGQAIARIGRSITKQAGVPADLLIISCLEDYSLCIPLLEKGARIFSPELLLNGIVIQKLEFSRHQLFTDHVKMTRSTIWLKDKVGGQFLPVNRCT